MSILILRRMLFLLAAFITLVVFFVVEEDWRGARAWQSYKREREAKGDPMDPNRVIPPKVPDDQNFGMAPYFASYFALSPEVLRQPYKEEVQTIAGQHTVQGDTALGGNSLEPAWLGGVPQRAPRPLGWHYGMAADLPGWVVLIQTNNGIAPTATDPAQAAVIILDAMKSTESVQAELRTASERPYARFNVLYEAAANPHVAGALPSQLAATKQVYQFFVLHAQAELVLGQGDAALQDINLMFRVDDALKDEPIIIAQLVRMAGLAVILQPVGEGVAEHRWSDAQLQALQARLQKVDVIASTVLGFRGERDLFMANAYEQPEVYGNWLLHGWARLEQVNSERGIDEYLLPRFDIAGHKISPIANLAADLALRNSTNESLGASFLHHRIMARMTLPSYTRTPEKAARSQAEVDIAFVACGLERFRLAEGHYPEKLDELVPRFASALPQDVINGEPLKYRRTEDGRFVLYSVGWNEKDDGGTVAKTPGSTPHQDFEQGDWVWENPAGN
jgi:hypothetical protein